MPNPSFHLFQLQKIDQQIDTIKKRLVEIEQIRKNNSSKMELESLLARMNQTLEEQKQAYDRLEEKSNAKKVKIEQSQSSLYGGSIKNPKELQDLQAEIKSLKDSLSSIEDAQIQGLLELELSEKEKSELESKMVDLENKLTIEYSAFSIEESEKNTLLSRLGQERQAIVDQVNPESHNYYQTLRKSKNGIAVSAIEDGSCAVCGSTLTPSECQIAKSHSQMASCPSCGRILYAG